MDLLNNGAEWALAEEDCIEHMPKMPEASVDFVVCSPPFPTLYAYTSKPEDIGNSEDLKGEARLHLSFFYHQLARVVKPGRAICIHIMQIPRLKRTGEVGLNDFRGLNIRLGERAGLVYEYDWLIWKNPQAQAIRTHSHELQFQGMERDRARCRGALGDYILKFRAPGDNAKEVAGKNQVSRNDWIQWASACWDDIVGTDTLNTAEGKGEDDTKHICPLQLEVIRRLVMLFTDPGEIVFSPFAGVGSEGYVALGGPTVKRPVRSIVEPRRFYGCEIKPEYCEAAKGNFSKAIKYRQAQSKTLFDLAGAHE